MDRVGGLDYVSFGKRGNSRDPGRLWGYRMVLLKLPRMPGGSVGVKWTLRYIVMTLACVLGGCSIGSDVFWSGPESEERDFSDTLAIYRRLVAEDSGKFLKYPGGLVAPQISSLRRAHPISPGDWVACLKGDAEGVSRTHAVFFQKRKIVDVRIAVLVDECDTQSFEPLTVLARSNTTK
jgi:hypothetical protein